MTDFTGFAPTPVQIRVDAQNTGYTSGGKRVLDFILAILALPFVLPVIAILCVLVRRDGGPGFFGHTRIGQNGMRFRCWKIRTMRPNAEDYLAEYLRNSPEAAKEWEADHKLTHDPRITPLGNFLRRSSLDELPQLLNILRGEMSFVGPRPIVTAELAKYGVYAESYISVKPGLTGLWQVSGRNEISYSERVQLDMDYIASQSLTQDLTIIAKTAQAVLARTGK
ncbi:MAG: sugar transferase [Paracoccaceae bacterium]